MTLQVLSAVMLIAAFIPLVGFAFVYGIWFPWKNSKFGVWTLVQKIMTAAYILLAALSHLWPDFPGRDVLRFAIVYPGLVIVFWAHFVILLKEWWTKRYTTKEKEHV